MYAAFSLAGAERYIGGRPGQVSSVLVRAAPGAIFSAPVARLAVILILGAAAGVIAAIRPARWAAGLPVLRAIATE